MISSALFGYCLFLFVSYFWNDLYVWHKKAKGKFGSSVTSRLALFVTMPNCESCPNWLLWVHIIHTGFLSLHPPAASLNHSLYSQSSVLAVCLKPRRGWWRRRRRRRPTKSSDKKWLHNTGIGMEFECCVVLCDSPIRSSRPAAQSWSDSSDKNCVCVYQFWGKLNNRNNHNSDHSAATGRVSHWEYWFWQAE